MLSRLHYYVIYVVDCNGFDIYGDNINYLAHTQNITWVSLYVVYVKSQIPDSLRVEVECFNTQAEAEKFIYSFIGYECFGDYELFLTTSFDGTKFTLMTLEKERDLIELEADSSYGVVRDIANVGEKLFSLSRFIRFPIAGHVANLCATAISYMELSRLRSDYFDTLLCYTETGFNDKETLEILDMIRERTKLDPVMNMHEESINDGAFNYRDYIIETEYIWMGATT